MVLSLVSRELMRSSSFIDCPPHHTPHTHTHLIPPTATHVSNLPPPPSLRRLTRSHALTRSHTHSHAFTRAHTHTYKGTAGCGVPLGINVESVSGFRDEIDATHELFRSLQAILVMYMYRYKVMAQVGVGGEGTITVTVTVMAQERASVRLSLH